MTSDLLGELEQLVLLTLVRLGAEAYGVPIIDELQKHVRRPVLRPSVDSALRRLETKRFIRSRMGEPEARRGGRARRYFEPTALGLKTLRESQRVMSGLLEGVALGGKPGARG